MPIECLFRRRISGFPDFHRAVLASSRQALAVGAEGHAVDRAGVPGKGEDLAARGGIPDLHLTRRKRPPPTGRGHALAIRAEGHPEDKLGVAPKTSISRPVAVSQTLTDRS